MREPKFRKGFSLIELLIAIVVLGILGTMLFSAGTSAQRRARITAAMTVFDDYTSAFNTAIMDHPGLVNDRKDTWEARDDSGTPIPYTSVRAFNRLVGYMNRSLSEELQLVPSADGKRYESVGADPWGGKYVLLETPDTTGQPDSVYWDMTTSANQAFIGISIWCTGPDSDIIIPDGTNRVTVRDISVGISIWDHAGDIGYKRHGSTEEDIPFLGATIPVK